MDILKQKWRALANVNYRSKKGRHNINPHYNLHANSSVCPIEYQQLNGYQAHLNGDFIAAQAGRYHSAYFALE